MFEFTPTPRVKRSPFYKATVRDGVKSFYPYNNMFLPTGYGNPDKEYWILINGVSLTISKVKKNSFEAWIIPHTYKLTNLSTLKKNTLVNIEVDILSKYVKKFLNEK